MSALRDDRLSPRLVDAGGGRAPPRPSGTRTTGGSSIGGDDRLTSTRRLRVGLPGRRRVRRLGGSLAADLDRGRAEAGAGQGLGDGLGAALRQPHVAIGLATRAGVPPHDEVDRPRLRGVREEPQGGEALDRGLVHGHQLGAADG